MPLLRVEPHLFAMLRSGFAVAAGDQRAPIDPALVHAVRGALTRADAGQRGRLPVVVRLTQPELVVLTAFFGCAAERLDGIDDVQRNAIVALLQQAARDD